MVQGLDNNSKAISNGILVPGGRNMDGIIALPAFPVFFVTVDNNI